MKKSTLLFFFILTANFFFAQSYNTVGGLRLGTELGITAKHRIANHTSLEGIIQSGLLDEEVLITLLAEQHYKVLTRRLNLYLGGGLHKGWINDDKILYDDPFGLTFIGGIDFTIKRWNISYDFKPAINLSGGYRTFSAQTGVSLRYVFVKRDSRLKKFMEEKKWKFWKKKKKD